MECGIKHKEKYPEAVRQFCISLCYHSVRAYEFVRQSFDLHLPHHDTIRSWYKNSDIIIRPGINEPCLKIIRTLVEQMQSQGKRLMLALMMDEMAIRRHIDYDVQNRTLVGMCQGHPSIENETETAKEAFVFMVNGINESFQIPVAYYFTHSTNATLKKQILTEVVESLIDCGAIVASLTFDGYRAHPTMCRLLGANLDVYSPEFQPYFTIKGRKIFIIYDNSHMQKLIRNSLASKEVLFDADGNQIKWQYITDVIHFSTEKGLHLTHRMNKSHLQWKKKIMKVRIATQTLSSSAADSIDFLRNENYEEFQESEPTTKFMRVFDRSFDIFNTKNDSSDNPFKQTLRRENKDEIFKFFNEAIGYIEGLQMKSKKGNLMQICRSHIKTGFTGFIINMNSLMQMYREYVVAEDVPDIALDFIPTYALSQDHLEIFFGKIRARGGFNDNPSSLVFTSAYQQLIVNNNILLSKHSNCSLQGKGTIGNPFSNILTISSKRIPKTGIHSREEWSFPDEDIDELHLEIDRIEAMERTSEMTEHLTDCTIGHIATVIENKIMNSNTFNCDPCRKIFDENKRKFERGFLSSGFKSHPCFSTYQICKATNRFIKVQLLRSKMDFNLVYYEILSSLDVNALYNETDFENHQEHKIFLIRYIVDEYIRIKGTFLARSETFKEYDVLLRNRYTKLLHFYGQ